LPTTCVQNNLYDRDYVKRWWNWEEYLAIDITATETSFANFESLLRDLYKQYTFEFAAA